MCFSILPNQERPDQPLQRVCIGIAICSQNEASLALKELIDLAKEVRAARPHRRGLVVRVGHDAELDARRRQAC